MAKNHILCSIRLIQNNNKFQSLLLKVSLTVKKENYKAQSQERLLGYERLSRKLPNNPQNSHAFGKEWAAFQKREK